MELIDMLTHDSCQQYIQGTPEKDDIYFVNLAMGGLQFQNRMTADQDFGLVTYPIATTDSTITVRTDVMQKKSVDDFQHVFSTNMLIAARNKQSQEKHKIPAIELSFSDNPDLAQNRYDLARQSNLLYRAKQSSRVNSVQAPIAKEFDLIQKLY